MKKTIIALIIVILLLLGFGVYSFVDNNRLKNENADLNAALLSHQEDLSAATAEYDKVAAEAAELTAQLADLTTQHETQAAELADAQKELTDAGAQIADLTAQNETLQSESAALQVDLDAAKSAAETTGKEHAALQAELAEEQLLTATLEKEAADAQAALDTANKQATELAVEAADKQAALDKAAAEAILLNAQIAELTQQAADAAADVSTKQTALDEANALLAESQTALSNANKQVEALNTQLTEALAANKQMDSLSAQVADAQADAASKQAALDNANAQLDTANAQLDTANAQLDALNTQMDTLKTQVDELLQQVSIAQADAVAKQTALDAAKTQVAELTAQVSDAQALAAKKQTALDAANAQVAALTTQVSDAQAQVADLDAQLYAAQHVDYAALSETDLLALMSAIAPALEANNYNVAYAPVPVYQDEAYLAALPQALQTRWALTVNNRESMTEAERMAFYAQLAEAELALLTPFDDVVYQDENLAKWAQNYLAALQSQRNAALSSKSATDDAFTQGWAENGQYKREQALYNINKTYPITVDAAYESIFADMLAQGECVDVHLSIEEALTRRLAFAALPMEQMGKSVSLASFTLANDTAHHVPLLTVEVDFMKKDKVVYTALLFGGELPAGASASTQVAITDKQFDSIAFRYDLTVETATHRDTFSGVITPDTQYAFNGTLKQY